MIILPMHAIRSCLVLTWIYLKWKVRSQQAMRYHPFTQRWAEFLSWLILVTRWKMHYRSPGLSGQWILPCQRCIHSPLWHCFPWSLQRTWHASCRTEPWVVDGGQPWCHPPAGTLHPRTGLLPDTAPLAAQTASKHNHTFIKIYHTMQKDGLNS